MDDQSSDSPFAFGAPNQQTAFDDVDRTGQQLAQVQQQFEQMRSRRNYIQAIAKGGSTRPGAIRSSISGNG